MDFDVYDILSVTGFIVLFIGLLLFEPWIALTVCGALLMAIGIVGAIR